MERDRLEFIFVGYQPPSTNDSYVPTSGRQKVGNRYRSAFFRKSKWLIDWQDKVASVFNMQYFYTREELEEFTKSVLDNNQGLYLRIEVSMPRRSYGVRKLCKKDASNYIKSIEDSIYYHIGIDDTRNVKVSSSKYYNNNDQWIIKAVITKTESAWNENSIISEESKYYEFK